MGLGCTIGLGDRVLKIAALTARRGHIRRTGRGVLRGVIGALSYFLHLARRSEISEPSDLVQRADGWCVEMREYATCVRTSSQSQ